ncbi:MAG: hydantoinase/oxoprolinase family protein [Planctomycetaceae bacterium]
MNRTSATRWPAERWPAGADKSDEFLFSIHMMHILGFDIGGANLKVSDADGRAASVPFAMWKQHCELPSKLAEIGHSVCRQPDLVAATMTAELADCFPTKAEGVEFVIRSLQQAFPEVPIRIWLNSGEFAEPDDAVELPMLVAAANWHALATWAGRAVPEGPSILIDMGSTTTDVIPLLHGRPEVFETSDLDRLLRSELVYTGAFRTPVCSVAGSVMFRRQRCPLAAELFATMADAYLIVGQLEEDASCTETADGRPLTRQASLNRMAHMLCCDLTEVTEQELQLVAEDLISHQRHQICSAVQTVMKSLQRIVQEDAAATGEPRGPKRKFRPAVILSGSGAQIARQAVDQFGRENFSEIMLLSDMSDLSVTQVATAFAIARLAHDRCQDDLLEETLF